MQHNSNFLQKRKNDCNYKYYFILKVMIAIIFAWTIYFISLVFITDDNNAQNNVDGAGSAEYLSSIYISNSELLSNFGMSAPFVEGWGLLPFEVSSGEKVLVDENCITKPCYTITGVELPIKKFNELLEPQGLEIDYLENEQTKERFTLTKSGENPIFIPTEDNYVKADMVNFILYVTSFTICYKDKIVSCKITLNGTTYGEGYILNVYKEDILYKQMYVDAETYVFDLEYVSNYDNTYTLVFVFGYYGKLTLSTGENTNTNVTASGRKVTISTFADTTITYALANPRINSTIII